MQTREHVTHLYAVFYGRCGQGPPVDCLDGCRRLKRRRFLVLILVACGVRHK
jgi:hypothetical protein